VGRENVYFWVFDENRPILDLMGVVPPENVITVRATGLVRFGLDVLRCLKKIRSLGVDATVDMEFFARASAILAFLTGATRRAGLHRFQAEGPYRGDLLTHRLQWNPYLHTTAAYYVLVETLVHDPAECPMLKVPAPRAHNVMPPPFVPSTSEVAEVRSILERAAGGPVDGPVVILNPNASDMLPLRKWPQERFVEVARGVLDETPDAFVAFSGAPTERKAAEALARAVGSPRAFSLAGATTLRQLLVFYTLADVLVTNDSGPGHFSALTDIDTVVLFGPETPALYGPLGHHASVLYAHLACSPCVNALNHRFSPCRNNVCMQMITVQQVLETVRSALARRRAHRAPEPQTASTPN
jgi:ADP-heptose:LPS heptosyltransferase